MAGLIPQAYAATSSSSNFEFDGPGIIVAIILGIWYIIWIVQAILGYGTAYRKTKANGDNGVSLFGWIIVYCSLAAIIPGLGFYLWKKSKDQPAVSAQYAATYQQPQYPPQGQYQQNPYQQYPYQQNTYQQNPYQNNNDYQQYR